MIPAGVANRVPVYAHSGIPAVYRGEVQAPPPLIVKQAVSTQPISQTALAVAIAGTGTLTYTVPSGYSKLLSIEFDPDLTVRLTLFAQKAYKNILNGYSTKVGSAVGVKMINYEQCQNDILNLNYVAVAYPTGITTPDLTFTLNFQ